jgi:hypothetical protein
MKIGILSDTHGAVHPAIHEHMAGVDLLLHGGDVGGEHVMRELELIAPVHAVRGNVDYDDLPLDLVLRLPCGTVAMRHGHLEDPSERHAFMQQHFRSVRPAMIVLGHSHHQYLEYANGCWIVNPGACCRPRLGTVATIMLLEWSKASGFDFCLIPLPIAS